MTTAWGVAGVVAVGLFVATGAGAARSRSRPGAPAFAALALVLAAVTASVSAWQLDLVPTELAQVPVTAGLVVPPLLWAGFVFEYTGRGPPITRGWGAALVGLGATTVGSTLLTAELDPADPTVAGRLVLTVTVLSQVAVFSLGLLGVFLVARAALTYDDIPGLRAVALTVGGLGVTLLPFWWLFAGSVPTATILSLTVGQLVATGGALALAQYDGLLADRPLTGHLARETILNRMGASVVIADQQGHILDANERASETFAIGRAELPERRIGDAVGLDPEGPDDRTVLETDRGPREFRVSRTRLTDARGSPVGTAYRLRDVTDEHTQEQKLTVFNRILRHNLRNDLDAVRGFAEAIRADGAADHADRIVDISGDLVELTTQLETANEILTDHDPTAEACDLVAVAEAAAETARSRVDAGTVTVAADGPVRVETDRELLRFALAELIANGLEHSSEPAPEVTVGLELRGEGADIEVRDDGPGLPANERAVLVGGEETPLRHGRGIGLWTVRWAVKRLGGKLAVAELDPHGTAVSVTLPDDRVR